MRRDLNDMLGDMVMLPSDVLTADCRRGLRQALATGTPEFRGEGFALDLSFPQED
jgi:hypothetical protein